MIIKGTTVTLDSGVSVNIRGSHDIPDSLVFELPVTEGVVTFTPNSSILIDLILATDVTKYVNINEDTEKCAVTKYVGSDISDFMTPLMKVNNGNNTNTSVYWYLSDDTHVNLPLNTNETLEIKFSYLYIPSVVIVAKLTGDTEAYAKYLSIRSRNDRKYATQLDTLKRSIYA
jgi:hypothetical protein